MLCVVGSPADNRRRINRSNRVLIKLLIVQRHSFISCSAVSECDSASESLTVSRTHTFSLMSRNRSVDETGSRKADEITCCPPTPVSVLPVALLIEQVEEVKETVSSFPCPFLKKPTILLEETFPAGHVTSALSADRQEEGKQIRSL